ncbi:hypothetical protein RB195_002627 [Necator americanus]|uniref:Uncharacterized protein n=1 Tax=Necator americanus TaxID=51031 RepID=A0ABR1DK53_NECAM
MEEDRMGMRIQSETIEIEKDEKGLVGISIGDTGSRTAMHSGGSSSGTVSQAEKKFDTSDIPTSRNRKPS